MSKNLTLILACLFSICHSAQNKYGFFNYEKVAQSKALGVKHQQKLIIYFRQLEDSLMILQNKLEEKYNKVPCKMDSAQKKKYEAILNKALLDLENYHKEAKEKYLKEELFLKDEMRKVIAVDIESFCRHNNLTAPASEEAAIYCEGCADYTLDIIDFLNK